MVESILAYISGKISFRNRGFVQEHSKYLTEGEKKKKHDEKWPVF